jgi:uncharacterized membrane protein (UPF0127 family)
MRLYRVINLDRGVVLAERARMASRARERLRGLLGSEGLSPGEGLILRPCWQVHTFGMRYPIDVLFLDAKGIVARMVLGMRPGRLSPLVLRSRTVVELPAGVLRETGTRPGDRIGFQPDFPRRTGTPAAGTYLSRRD